MSSGSIRETVAVSLLVCKCKKIAEASGKSVSYGLKRLVEDIVQEKGNIC